MKYILLILTIIIQLVGLMNCAVSDYFQLCHRSSKNMSQCFEKTTENLFRRLKNSIPELDLPPIEPLHIDKLPFKIGSDNSLNNLTEVLLWGISDTKFDNGTAKLSKRGLFFRVKVRIPTMKIDGIYEFDSTLLFLRLKGRGSIQINTTDVTGEFSLKGHMVQKNGENYLQFDGMTGILNMGKASVSIQRFSKDSTLNKVINDLVNDNFNIIFDDIKPMIIETLSKYFTNLANKATMNFTVNELFPI